MKRALVLSILLALTLVAASVLTAESPAVPASPEVSLQSSTLLTWTALPGCTADDCRVCNRNGLMCEPTGGSCNCVPWPI